MTGPAARAGGFGAPRPRTPRLAMFAGVAAAHSAALLLLLARPPYDLAEAEAALAVFDVISPPPPAVEPPEPEPPPALGNAAAQAGGSPGRRRERAAQMVDRPRPPERSAIDTTFAPQSPALPAPGLDAGTAALDLGGGGLDGSGTGTGSGSGDGSGGGTSLVSIRYGDAEWIERPTPSAWRAAWPRTAGGQALKGPVFVLLGCHLEANGRPRRCKVLHASPDHAAFGRAAIKLVADARVRPVRLNGEDLRKVPVGIPILFNEKSASETTATSPAAVAGDPAITAKASAPPAR